MCLLVYQMGKEKMKDESFKEAFKTNSDWVGILVRNHNWDIKINKYKSVDLALKEYKEIKDEEYKDIVIHFRMWTSWGKDYDMMHPFSLWAKSWGWLFHNWVISEAKVPRLEWMSDTASLAEYIKGMELNEKQLYSRWIQLLFRNIMTDYDKFLVISKNNIRIYWEHKWHWNRGLWYSNDTYKVYNTSYSRIEEDETIMKWK